MRGEKFRSAGIKLKDMKITAQELRIGNLLTWKDEEDPSNAILTVVGLYLNDDIWLEWEWEDGEKDNTDCDLDSVRGIPLADGWLQKLGFVHFRKDKCWYIKIDGRWCVFNVCKPPGFKGYLVAIDNTVLRAVKYVHQLQNLFFALINEELELK